MIYSINISLFFIFFIDNLVVFLSICCKKKHPRNSKCRKLLCEREGNITNITGKNVYYNASNRIAWSVFLPSVCLLSTFLNTIRNLLFVLFCFLHILLFVVFYFRLFFVLVLPVVTMLPPSVYFN